MALHPGGFNSKALHHQPMCVRFYDMQLQSCKLLLYMQLFMFANLKAIGCYSNNHRVYV